MTWVVAGALGGVFCGVVQACALGNAVGSVTGALTIVVGRLATVGAALGLTAWFLDVLARRLVKKPRNARVVLLALLSGAVAVMMAGGTHGRDGGPWGAFGFLAIGAAGVTYAIGLVAPRRRPNRWPLVALLGCFVSVALLVFDPEGLRGTYKSLDLLLLGLGLGAAAAGLRVALHGKGLVVGLSVAILAVAVPRFLDESSADLSTLATRSARVDVVDRALVASGLWPARRLDQRITDVDPAALLQPPRPRNDVRAAFAELRKSGEPLNVLWVTIDALRSDATGLDGDTASSLTPNLDDLARSGFAFPDAWSQAPQTTGSMESFLTGRYPSRTPVASGWRTGKVTFEAPSIVELAREAGFETAWFTGLRKDTLAAPIWERLKRGFTTVNEEKTAAPDARRTVTQAIEWLRADRARFFALVHLFDPHAPYVSWEGKTDATPRERWESEVRHADAALGELLGALEREGLAGHTIVIAHADHGEAFNEHGRYYHGTSFFQTQIHVPLVIRVPGLEGAALRGPASNIDIAPTLVDLLGAAPEAGHQGHSLLARLLDPELSWPKLALAETLVVDPQIPWGEDRIRAITDGRWKLIEYPDGPARLLYDLHADPGEKKNLAATHPEEVRRLRGWIKSLDMRLGSEGASKTSPATTADELMRLLTNPEPHAGPAAFRALGQEPSCLAGIEDALASYTPGLQHTVMTLIDEFLAADLDGPGRDVPLGAAPSPVRFRLLERLGRSPRFWDTPMPATPDNLVDAERHALQVALAARGDATALRHLKSIEPAPPKAWEALLPALARAGDPDAYGLALQLGGPPHDLLLRILRGLTASRQESFIAYVVDRWPHPERQVRVRVLHRIVDIALGLDGETSAAALIALHGNAQPADQARITRRLAELDPSWTPQRVRETSAALTRARFEETAGAAPTSDDVVIVGMAGVAERPFDRVLGPPRFRLRNVGTKTVVLGRGGLHHLQLTWRNGTERVPAARVVLPRTELEPGAERSVVALLRYPRQAGRWRLTPVAADVTYVVPQGSSWRGPEIARHGTARLPLRALETSTLLEVPDGGDMLSIPGVPADTDVLVSVAWDLDAEADARVISADGSESPMKPVGGGQWRGLVRTAANGTLGIRVNGGPRLVHVAEITVTNQ